MTCHDIKLQGSEKGLVTVPVCIIVMCPLYIYKRLKGVFEDKMQWLTTHIYLPFSPHHLPKIKPVSFCYQKRGIYKNNRWRFVRGHDKPIHGSGNRHLLSRWYNFFAKKNNTEIGWKHHWWGNYPTLGSNFYKVLSTQGLGDASCLSLSLLGLSGVIRVIWKWMMVMFGSCYGLEKKRRCLVHW